jgi:putative spermidine/putrescine transport system permease protein
LLGQGPHTSASIVTGRSGATAPRPRLSWGSLALPAFLYLVVFYAWPVASIALTSVTRPSPGLENFRTVLSDPLVDRALFLTVATAFAVTAVCLVLGYPIAYLMTVAPAGVSRTFLMLLLVSLWLSQVARTFALQVILNDTGLINQLLIGLGVINGPLPLIRSPLGVTIGMTQILLPTMVLPLYVVMGRIDPDLGRAASGLGAGPAASFLRVFLPLSVPGILTGCLLVFVLSLGFYITPLILGGGGYIMISQLVVQQVQHLNQPIGSADSVVLLVMTLAVLAVAARLVGLGSLLSPATEA